MRTNDRQAGTLTIGLKMFVEVPILVTPSYVFLSGIKGKSSTKTVDIAASQDRPLQLEPRGFNLQDFIDYRIEEVEENRRYRIYFVSQPDAEGTFSGFLNLKTNYPEKPTLHIRIRGRIQD